MTVYDRIRALREQKGLSQQELANKVGFKTASAVNKIELGLRDISQTKLSQFAKALDTTPGYLLGWDGYDDMPAPITTEDTVTFPVIGEVAAGYEHIMTEDWSGETIEVPASYLHGRPRSDYFCLRVIGDSMYPLYLDGDRVLVLKSDTLQHSGDIGVVRYDNDMATLKKVEFTMGEDWLRLVPINPSYPPRTITGCNLEQCSIIGVPKLIVREV